MEPLKMERVEDVVARKNAVQQERMQRNARRAELEYDLMQALTEDQPTQYPGQFLSYVESLASGSVGTWRDGAKELLEIWSQP